MPKVDTGRIVQALLAAQAAGRSAADASLEELVARFGHREQYDYSAGAVLHLVVPPASRLAKDLKRLCDSVNWIAQVLPSGTSGEIVLAIKGMSFRQDQCINIAAEEAALAVLRERLGLEGYVTSTES